MYTLLIALLLSLNVISSSQEFENLPDDEKLELEQIIIQDMETF